MRLQTVEDEFFRCSVLSFFRILEYSLALSQKKKTCCRECCHTAGMYQGGKRVERHPARFRPHSLKKRDFPALSGTDQDWKEGWNGSIVFWSPFCQSLSRHASTQWPSWPCVGMLHRIGQSLPLRLSMATGGRCPIRREMRYREGRARENN